MNLRKRSPVSVVAEAVARAERGLADLGLSFRVRELHARVAAVKTVLFGLVRATPTVTAGQRERLAVTAVMLADEVEARRRETLEPVSGVLPVGGAQPVVRTG